VPGEFGTASPPPFEIIVVADGDTDGSGAYAERLVLRVLRLRTAEGPARARNLGASKARASILFFVDADVPISRDTIGRVAEAFRHYPDVAAVMGSYDDHPGDPNFLSQYRNLLHHWVHQEGREEASTFWGACGAMRRTVFEMVGGFDETYRTPSIEDIEIGYRSRRELSDQTGEEPPGHSLEEVDPPSIVFTDVFCRALPWTALMLSHRRILNDLYLQTSGRISAVFAGTMVVGVGVAWWWRWAIVIVGLAMMGLLALNHRLYRWFIKKRGLFFPLRAILLHWAYFLYSGLTFGAGALGFLMKSWTKPTLGASVLKRTLSVKSVQSEKSK
jgi:glycosyltransferase involved in cell wall biosynthesis